MNGTNGLTIGFYMHNTLRKKLFLIVNARLVYDITAVKKKQSLLIMRLISVLRI